MRTIAGESGRSLRSEAIASARSRFLRWGFSGSSLSTIAEDLGVTKAALYYHFPDKEAIFLAVFDEYLTGIASDLAALEPRLSAREAFEALARVFLSRGEDCVRMDRLAFQESRHLSAAGRAALGERYHRDLVRPLEERFAIAEREGWIGPAAEGEPQRVWLFMGLLSAFFAPGHEAGPDMTAAGIGAAATAFASIMLNGIGFRR